jgi:plasmid stability protein
MRTTVTIDDDLLDQVKVLAARTRRSVSSVLEDALRAMLDRPSLEQRKPVKLTTYPGGHLQPGVDLYNKEQIAELVGDNELPFR